MGTFLPSGKHRGCGQPPLPASSWGDVRCGGFCLPPGPQGRGLLSLAQREWVRGRGSAQLSWAPWASHPPAQPLDPPGGLRGHCVRQPMAGLERGLPGWDAGRASWDKKGGGGERGERESHGEGDNSRWPSSPNSWTLRVPVGLSSRELSGPMP